MKTTLVCLLLLLSTCVFSQNSFKTIDRKNVEAEVTDTASENYYMKLLDRLNAFDTTLSLEQLRLLYYGFVFQGEYSGYNDMKRKEILEEINAGNFKKAIELGEEVLEEVPVSIETNYLVLTAWYLKDKEDVTTQNYIYRYTSLRDAVLSSGDGLTCETAFKTIFVDDEYNLLNIYFEIEHRAQYLINNCDKFDVQPNEYFDSKEIYFDTSETLAALMKMFDQPKDDSDNGKKKKKNKKD